MFYKHFLYPEEYLKDMTITTQYAFQFNKNNINYNKKQKYLLDLTDWISVDLSITADIMITA